jgi:hypothetical protein
MRTTVLMRRMRRSETLAALRFRLTLSGRLFKYVLACRSEDDWAWYAPDAGRPPGHRRSFRALRVPADGRHRSRPAVALPGRPGARGPCAWSGRLRPLLRGSRGGPGLGSSRLGQPRPTEVLGELGRVRRRPAGSRFAASAAAPALRVGVPASAADPETRVERDELQGWRSLSPSGPGSRVVGLGAPDPYENTHPRALCTRVALYFLARRLSRATTRQTTDRHGSARAGQAGRTGAAAG